MFNNFSTFVHGNNELMNNFIIYHHPNTNFGHQKGNTSMSTKLSNTNALLYQGPAILHTQTTTATSFHSTTTWRHNNFNRADSSLWNQIWGYSTTTKLFKGHKSTKDFFTTTHHPHKHTIVIIWKWFKNTWIKNNIYQM